MGQTAFVKSPARPFTAERITRSLHLNLDIPLTALVIALLVIGLMMVYSASWKSAQGAGEADSYYVLRQLLFVAIGCVATLALSLFDYHRYQRLVVPIIVLAIAMLIGVLLKGEERFNSSRTLFNGSIQPSEFATLGLIIYLAFWLYSKREVLNILSLGLFPMSFILGILGVLIWQQPDFSATITIFVLGGILFYLAGADLRQVILVLLGGLFVGFLVIQFTSTGQDRWAKFLAGLTNPFAASDHMQRVFEAITRGGLFGVGIGKGITKFTGLPVPWTDSIYAVIIEETGVIGGAFVLSLYMFFLWRGMQIAKRAPDQLGRLLAGGITLWIVFDALLNMGVMVSIFPFAGNALPLVSYGGSSMLVTMAGMGILMNVHRSSSQNNSASSEGRSYGAVIDMRRRDRRRRVSRSVGPEGTGE